MAELITGLQGSGKSYKAMYDMYYQQDKYYKIFTNLDGLKQTDKILPLNFKKFTDEILTECYDIIVTQSKEYEDVIEYLQRIYMLPTNVDKDNRVMLVIDEAQNYFNKKNPILAWFITQHRHMFFEVILITQKYTLLHSDYHLFNTAYNAFPPVKQFLKSKIAYNQYAGLPLNKDNFVRKFSLKKEDKIFDMYISGDKVESPNILKQFIPILILSVGVVLGGVYYFKNMYGHHEVKTSSSPQVNSQGRSINPTTSKTKEQTYVDLNEKLYTFVLFEDKFYIQGLTKDIYTPRLLNYIKKKYFITVIDTIKLDDWHTSLYVVCDSAIESFFSNRSKILEAGVDRLTSFN